MEKRPHEETFFPSKRQRMETSLCSENTFENEFNMASLPFDTSIVLTQQSTHNMLEPERLSPHTNSNLQDFIDNFFKDSDFQMMDNPASNLEEPIYHSSNLKDYKENFVKDLNFQDCLTSTPVTSLDENIPDPSAEKERINPSTTTEPTNTISCIQNSRCRNSIVFEKELGDFIFLTLKLHNRQYFVNIREVSTKNGLSMDIPSWYEFQYKIFAFSLKYKSSSFVANNNILVLNCNNSTMHIKHLKNYQHIDLSGNQLEKN